VPKELSIPSAGERRLMPVMPEFLPNTHDLTRLVEACAEGDSNGFQDLFRVMYGELRALASRALNHERKDHTLSATALVHEVYLRLVDQTRAQWRERAQFLSVAAQVMRRILVDHARRRGAEKRGANAPRERLIEDAVAVDAPSVDPVALDQALTRLAAFDPRQCKIVELRYFVGLTIEETGEVLGISPASVKRDWVLAKAWLRRELDEIDTF